MFHQSMLISVIVVVLASVVPVSEALGEKKDNVVLPDGVQLITTFDKMGPRSVVSDTNGDIYVAGNKRYNAKEINASRGIYINKFDYQGKSIWGTSEVAAEGDTVAREVVVDQNGNIFVIGDSGGLFGESPRGRSPCYVIKLNQDGRKSWVKRFGPKHGKMCLATSGAVDKNGNVIVVGFGLSDSESGKDSHNFTIVQKIASDGDIVWQKQFDTAQIEYTAMSLTLDRSEYIYITGWLSFDSESIYFLWKLDQQGNKRWEKKSAMKIEFIMSECVATDSSGNVYIAGYARGNIDGLANVGGADVYLMKFNEAGDKVWTRSIASSRNELIHTMKIDKNDQIIMIGSTDGVLSDKGQTTTPRGYDYFIARYNTNGDRLSLLQFGSAGNDIAYGSALDPNGNLYIVGEYGKLRILLRMLNECDK